MHASRAVSLMLFLVAGACRYVPSASPLQGAPADIAALAGRWDGEFWSDASGRRGTLQFTIREGTDTLYGDVVLTPGGTGGPVIAADARDAVHLRHSRAPELLHIRFVGVHGVMVEGELEPYVAPDCECVVVTEFVGRVVGDSIAGTYTTHGSYVRQQGRWGVRRAVRAE